MIKEIRDMLLIGAGVLTLAGGLAYLGNQRYYELNDPRITNYICEDCDRIPNFAIDTYYKKPIKEGEMEYYDFDYDRVIKRKLTDSELKMFEEME